MITIKRLHKIRTKFIILFFAGFIVMFGLYIQKNTNVYANENDLSAIMVSLPENYLAPCSYKGSIEEISLSENTVSDNICDTDETISCNDIYVYLPYGYDATKQYNIVYHQCGFGSTDNELMNETAFKNVLDNLISNDIEPIIFVVIPDMTYGKTKSFKNHMLEVMEIVESNYSTYAGFDTSKETLIASSSHRFIGGFSQGAFATWDILSGKNSQYADYYAPISPFYAKNWNYERKVSKAASNNDHIIVYNTIGEFECAPEYSFDGIEQFYALQNAMNDNNITNYSFIIEEGKHTQENCMTAYYYILKQIF